MTKRFLPRLLLCVLVAFCLFAVSAASAEEKPAAPQAGARLFEAEVVTDVAYYKGDDAHPRKHKLDLYLPKGHKDYPVLFFVHGGAWRSGDKNFARYSSLGKFYARRGIGTVDQLSAVAIGRASRAHQGRRPRLRLDLQEHRPVRRSARPDFSVRPLGGRPSGGVARDRCQLPQGRGRQGDVIPVLYPSAGSYRIPGRFLESVFGKDTAMRRRRVPIEHVRPGLPPFLTCTPTETFPLAARCLPRRSARRWWPGAVRPKREIKKSSHIKIIMSAGGGRQSGLRRHPRLHRRPVEEAELARPPSGRAVLQIELILKQFVGIVMPLACEEGAGVGVCLVKLLRGRM